MTREPKRSIKQIVEDAEQRVRDTGGWQESMYKDQDYPAPVLTCIELLAELIQVREADSHDT